MAYTSTNDCSNSDASSSFSGDCSIFDEPQISSGCPIVSESTEDQDPEYTSYDEFCMTLRDRINADNSSEVDTAEHRPKKFSYVSNWRRKLIPADLTILVPPSPLFRSFDSPSSPVASIDPMRLCVTSVPPSEYESDSPNSTTHEQPSPLFETDLHGIVEIPTFDDKPYYNADLDEASDLESSSSLPDFIPEVYLPKASSSTRSSPTPSPKKRRFQNVSSAIRWLPTRIKYSILSQTMPRSSRK